MKKKGSSHATIGLDKFYYSTVIENNTGEETCATPKPLAKAISAELSMELAEAIFYANDGASEVVKEFESDTLTLGSDDLKPDVVEELIGFTLYDNKVLITASEDGAKPVEISFPSPTF
ncbi:hypothetical protein ACUH9Y_04400 [Dermabacteraceae bacterium P13115]